MLQSLPRSLPSPCLMSRQKKRMAPASSAAAAAAAALLLLLGAASAREVVTNQFHVHINPDIAHVRTARDTADQIALENGFHNLGPVSDADKKY